MGASIILRNICQLPQTFIVTFEQLTLRPVQGFLLQGVIHQIAKIRRAEINRPRKLWGLPGAGNRHQEIFRQSDFCSDLHLIFFDVRRFMRRHIKNIGKSGLGHQQMKIATVIGKQERAQDDDTEDEELGRKPVQCPVSFGNVAAFANHVVQPLLTRRARISPRIRRDCLLAGYLHS